MREAHLADCKMSLQLTIRRYDKKLAFAILYSCDLAQNNRLAKFKSTCLRSGIYSILCMMKCLYTDSNTNVTPCKMAAKYSK